MEESIDLVVAEERSIQLWIEMTGEDPSKQVMLLPADMRDSLIAKFLPLAQQINTLSVEARDVSVADEHDVEGMKEARRYRIAMKNIRCEAENERKQQKAWSLIVGKAIDSIGNAIKERATAVENRLQELEDTAKRAEEARREARRVERTEKLLPYVDDVSEFNLSDMSDGAFDKLLAGQIAIHEQTLREEAEREAAREAAREEAERAARERAAEMERLRVENEALRAAAIAPSVTVSDVLRAQTSDVDTLRAIYRHLTAIEVPELSGSYAPIGRGVKLRIGTLCAWIVTQIKQIDDGIDDKTTMPPETEP